MSRYFIEDVKCGYDTCFDCCGPHTTVASAIKYKNDDGKTGWLYCIQPEGYDPMIALHDDDVYEEIIRGEFPEIDYEAEMKAEYEHLELSDDGFTPKHIV